MVDINIKNVSELLEAVQTIFEKPRPRGNWFRGHSDAEWQLLVFSGDRKSVTTPLDRHVFADGLNYSVTTRQKPVIVRLAVPEEAELCALIITRLINEAKEMVKIVN